MNDILLTFADPSAFLIAAVVTVAAVIVSFLPSKQLDLRPVRVRRDSARRHNRR